MANFSDLVGSFMQNAMTSSGGSRVGSALEQLQQSGAAGTAASGSAAGGLLGGLMDAVQGGLSSAARNPMQAGGLGALAGSLFGGGKSAVGGAVGGGMLALLGSVAMKALLSAGENAQGGANEATFLGRPVSGGTGQFSGGDTPITMHAPRNTAEQEALESTAQLVLKGMINAAKSDGQISPSEMQRIVGKLQESGADRQAQEWVMQQMTTPLNVEAFAAEIPNAEVAAEVYAASLLAIEVDTEAERRYLQDLARASGLHPLVVGQIHQTLGVTA